MIDERGEIVKSAGSQSSMRAVVRIHSYDDTTHKQTKLYQRTINSCLILVYETLLTLLVRTARLEFQKSTNCHLI
jgi:hypothetical protein